MDALDMMIAISIGNMVGWLAAMYVRNALRGLIGHVVISTLGAFVAGYVSQKFVPEIGRFALIIGGIIGAVLVLYAVRFRKWHGSGR